MVQEYNDILAQYLSFCTTGDPKAEFSPQFRAELWDSLTDILVPSEDVPEHSLRYTAHKAAWIGWPDRKGEGVHYFVAATLIYAIDKYERPDIPRDHPLRVSALKSIDAIRELCTPPN